MIKKILLTMATFMVAILVLLLFFPSCTVRQFIYPGRHQSEGDTLYPERMKQHAVTFTASDGTKLQGWLYNRGRSAPLVALYGGNGMDVAILRDMVEADTSRSYLMLNYRGYGHSEGAPSQPALVSDACEALHWAKARLGSPRSTHLLGYSIGSGVAMQVAGKVGDGIDSMVLICPFDSLQNTAKEHAGALIAFLTRHDAYDSAAIAPYIHCPVTIIAGRQDDIVFPVQTERLVEAFPEHNKPQIHWYDATHYNIFVQRGFNRLLNQGLRSK